MKKSSQFPLAAFPIMQGLLLLLIAGLCAAAGAQRAASISEVKTLCIGDISGGDESVHLRESLIRHLSKSSRFRLVETPANADAIVTGTGQIWVRGFIAINPRTPSTDRQAVYGGYLSLEMVGADRQPLWSWLVTPSGFSWSSIVDNLASHAAERLIQARETVPASSSASIPAGSLARTGITGAGATFPAPLYQKWFEDFERLHPGVAIRYSPAGSQFGDEKLAAGELDFAGSDIAPDLVVGTARAANLRRFATVLGAVVPIYNLKGVTRDLRFTPETLADIYLGRVRRWNDPEIRRFNKGVNLPDAEIVVVRRSDGSGTTWVWSDFLSKVSPAWSSSLGRGATLNWPIGTGAERNEGVADLVRKTPNSIGYVELTYAVQRQLSFGAVRNRAGEFIHADLDSLAEAAKVSGDVKELPPDITNPVGKFAYPISAFTWLVVPARTENPAKRAALAELLMWVLSAGQKECSALGYVALPREIADSELRKLNTLR